MFAGKPIKHGDANQSQWYIGIFDIPIHSISIKGKKLGIDKGYGWGGKSSQPEKGHTKQIRKNRNYQ